MISESSSPEQPGTAIFHAEYGPDGTKTAITVTRADRWILVNREFAHRLRDEGELNWQPLTIIVGRPDSVMYRFDRKFNEHSDLYERIDDEPTDEGITDPDPMVAELLASNPPIEKRDDTRMATELTLQHERDDEALREITHQAIRSAARVDELNEELAKAGERNKQLRAVLDEVLGSFTQQGHPGEPCLRTDWIGTRTVARWRRIAAGKPGYDEMIERLAGVELTDWQREHLREVWDYREVHGRWPGQIHSIGGRRNGVATEREALHQLIRLAEQAGA